MGWSPGRESIEGTSGKSCICDGRGLTSLCHVLLAGSVSKGSVLMELEEALPLVTGEKRWSQGTRSSLVSF